MSIKERRLKRSNTKKQAFDSEDFLLENYRKGLLTQKEYQAQKDKLIRLKKEYGKIIK